MPPTHSVVSKRIKDANERDVRTFFNALEVDMLASESTLQDASSTLIASEQRICKQTIHTQHTAK